MNINKAILVGRLTRDPEVRTTATGQTVTSISLATNRFWKDKNGQKQDQTEFHNVVLWGKLGEIAGQYLTKGQEAYIEGRLTTRKYTGKDGIEKRTTEIVAENMQLGSRAGQGGGQSAGTYNRPAAAPAQAQSPQAPMAEEIPTINLDEEEDEVRIEDVPF
jgi:single-strand DNA-binding protein